MPSQSLTPKQFRQLLRLNARLSRVLGLETISAARDPVTGAFKGGSSVTASALRAAWSIPPRSSIAGNAFKSRLLAAIRAPRAPRV